MYQGNAVFILHINAFYSDGYVEHHSTLFIFSFILFLLHGRFIFPRRIYPFSASMHTFSQSDLFATQFYTGLGSYLSFDQPIRNQTFVRELSHKPNSTSHEPLYRAIRMLREYAATLHGHALFQLEQ